jgi:pyrroloquinoline quinone biosynthesis protein D
MSLVTSRRARSCPRQARGRAVAGPRHISVSKTSHPVLPRHTKPKFDDTRKVWVILAPERVLAPDEIAVEVLKLCDGARSVADVVDQLAIKYAAPREAILSDVIAMLQDLADKGFLTEPREKTS